MSDDANGSTSATEAATTTAAAAQGAVTEGATDTTTQTAAADAGAAADGQAADPGKKDGAAAEDAGAVEPFAITAPEGAEAFQGDFDTFAGEMDGWLKANPNATARDALIEAANRQARVVGQSQKDMLTAQKDYEKQIDTWGDEIRKDPDFAGENFDKNVATVIKGVEALGGSDLRQRLDQTGLGNHPGIVKAFFLVGKQIGETGVVTGQTGTSTRSNFADALYGSGNGKG